MSKEKVQLTGPALAQNFYRHAEKMILRGSCNVLRRRGYVVSANPKDVKAAINSCFNEFKRLGGGFA